MMLSKPSMKALSWLLTALPHLLLVVAQNNPCLDAGFIQEQAQLDIVDNCTTFIGNVFVYITSGSGNFSNDISLTGNIQAIAAGLCFVAMDPKVPVTSIGSPGLVKVGEGNFVIYPQTPYQQLIGGGNDMGVGILEFPLLESISFPLLREIAGDLNITGNANLDSIDFPSLSAIGGNVVLVGNFSSINFGKLEMVNGSINVQSTSPVFQCPSNFEQLNLLPGKGFKCEGSIAQPQANPLPSTKPSQSATPSHSSANGIDMTLDIGTLFAEFNADMISCWKIYGNDVWGVGCRILPDCLMTDRVTSLVVINSL